MVLAKKSISLYLSSVLILSAVFAGYFYLPESVSASPVYRSHSSVNYSVRTNTTITAPSGIQNGDLLLIIFNIGSSGTIPTPTPPSGFTVLSGYPPVSLSDGNFDLDTYIWYKNASGESGDYIVTHSSASTDAYMVAVSDAQNVILTSTTDSGTGTTATAPSITTSGNDSLVFFWSISWNAAGGLTPPTGSTPTFTERLDSASILTYVADGVLAIAGATGDKTHTVDNNVTNPWRAGLIAVNPSVSSDLSQVKVRTGPDTITPGTGTSIKIRGGGEGVGDVVAIDTQDYSTAGHSANTMDVSVTVAPNNNRALVLFVYAGNQTNGVVSSISGGGTSCNSSWSKVGSSGGNNSSQGEVWVCLAPSTGAQTITINFAGNTDQNMGAVVYSLYNVNQSSPTSDFQAENSGDLVVNTSVGDMTISAHFDLTDVRSISDCTTTRDISVFGLVGVDSAHCTSSSNTIYTWGGFGTGSIAMGVNIKTSGIRTGGVKFR